MIAGTGRVEVERSGARSVVVSLSTRSPLKVLSPRSHGGAAWLYVTSYGGGLVDGDALDLTLSVGPGARALLTTQASTKIYPGRSSQSLTAEVGEGGLLVSLPDPVMAYGGARYTQRARVDLSAGASLVWLESLTSGRVAFGERWKLDGYASHTAIDRGGLPLVRDGLVLEAPHVAARTGGFDALASLFVAGPSCAALRAHLLGSVATRAPVFVAASPVGDDAAALRIAAPSAEALSRTLARLLGPLRDLLGDDLLARKLVADNALR